MPLLKPPGLFLTVKRSRESYRNKVQVSLIGLQCFESPSDTISTEAMDEYN